MTVLDRLFAPLAILPAQQPQRYVRGEPGVVALLAAVLEEALRNAAGVVLSNSSRAGRPSRVAEEAQEWLLSPEEDYVFACRPICGALGIDPDAFQAEVKVALLAGHLKRGSYRRVERG